MTTFEKLESALDSSYDRTVLVHVPVSVPRDAGTAIATDDPPDGDSPVNAYTLALIRVGYMHRGTDLPVWCASWEGDES